MIIIQKSSSLLGPNTFYDDLKNTMTEQAELNRKEFEHLEDDMRVQYEGFRAGMYVRIEVSSCVTTGGELLLSPSSCLDRWFSQSYE